MPNKTVNPNDTKSQMSQVGYRALNIAGRLIHNVHAYLVIQLRATSAYYWAWWEVDGGWMLINIEAGPNMNGVEK